MLRPLFWAGALALIPMSAAAQQFDVKSDAVTFPPGITVVASGTTTVADWVVATPVYYQHKAASVAEANAAARLALTGLETLMVKMGLVNAVCNGEAYSDQLHNGMVASADAQAELLVDPAKMPAVLSAIRATGWRAATHPDSKLEPLNPDAATDAALKIAVAVARARASAIAEADGRHIGKLINVTPLPEYYLTQPYRLFPTMNVPDSGPTVTEGAVFTFELVP